MKKPHIHIHLNAPVADAAVYKASSQPSQFGGHRAVAIMNGREVWLSQAAWKTEAEASRAAMDYIEQLKRGVKEPRTPIKGTAQDALSLSEAERELKAELKLIEVFKKSGKPVPREMVERKKMLEEEVEKAKIKFGDADDKFVTKVDVRLPDHPAFGNRAGKVMPKGTVVYKTGPLYRPWWSKESEGVLRLNPSDVVSEKTVSGDEILKKISKVNIAKKFREGDWEAISDLTRSGYQEVRDLVSGKRFTVEVTDAGFTEYNPREVARLKDQLKKADNDLASGKLNPGQHSKLVESINKELKGYRS